MRRKRLNVILQGFLSLLLALGVCSAGLAQGRGRGAGGGGGRGTGGGSGMGNPNRGWPDSSGIDRGLERSSNASKGRADKGRSTAADRSNGRSEAGLSRARMASDNLRRADKELREHPGIGSALHVSANDLRTQYQAALLTNPELKFGQFVAATRVAQNLGRRHPNITRTAILAGLASGRSLGQTLQDLGLSEHQANEARKQSEREIKRARDQ